MRQLVTGLCVLSALAGCAPGAANVAVSRPSGPVVVRCGGSHRPYDARLILGLAEREAQTIVSRWGCVYRATEADGKPAPASGGLLAGRVDVETEEGRVTRIRGVG
jgi:hypothetical protein